MLGASRISVVILYAHPLLGEGLARILAAEPGLHVIPLSTGDLAAAEAALAAGPDVVIFEHSEPLQALDVLKLAPEALLIDLGIGPEPTFTYRREEIPSRPEGILGAIRGARVARFEGPAEGLAEDIGRGHARCATPVSSLAGGS